MKHLTKIHALSALSAILAFTSCNKMPLMPGAGGAIKTITVKNIVVPEGFVESGTFKGVGDATVNSPLILPGQEVSFSFFAGKGQTLSFATMYGWSKDLFFAPAGTGLKLFNDDGTPITGDVSGQIMLWDDGTKTNGLISSTGPATGGGLAESNPIMEVGGHTDAQGNTYAEASKLMNLSLDYNNTTSQFTLTIKNISGSTNNVTPFSPGVWAVSNSIGGMLLDTVPFFNAGEKDRGQGLSHIAQMGDNTALAAFAAGHTGIITALSPVLVVVYHGSGNPIFSLNEKDRGQGLANIAQRGMVSTLDSALQKMKGVSNIYVLGSAPIGPGVMQSADISYTKGDKIYLATMFGSSNNWFFANESGIDPGKTGDVSGTIGLYDDGTALEQYPGAGNRQAGFGGIQIPKSSPVMEVGDEFPVPAVKNIIQVSLN